MFCSSAGFKSQAIESAIQERQRIDLLAYESHWERNEMPSLAFIYSFIALGAKVLILL